MRRLLNGLSTALMTIMLSSALGSGSELRLIREIPAPERERPREPWLDRFGDMLRRLLDPGDYQLFVTDSLLWSMDTPVRVAFLGGDQATRDSIRIAASEWTAATGLTLDFGVGTRHGTWWEWSRGDKKHRGDIRISFHDSVESRRYLWSDIGTRGRKALNANEASMNLENLNVKKSGWKGDVLHEFGHALGAHHEHQDPTRRCDREIRWYDEKGYTLTKDRDGWVKQDSLGHWPGMFTAFKYETGWDSTMTRTWLTPLDPSSAFRSTGFDSLSIMKYFLNPAALLKREESPCYSPWPDELSEKDRLGMRDFYPPDPKQARERKERVLAIRAKILEFARDARLFLNEP